jgi:competence protein ComEC
MQSGQGTAALLFSPSNALALLAGVVACLWLPMLLPWWLLIPLLLLGIAWWWWRMPCFRWLGICALGFA